MNNVTLAEFDDPPLGATDEMQPSIGTVSQAPMDVAPELIPEEVKQGTHKPRSGTDEPNDE